MANEKKEALAKSAAKGKPAAKKITKEAFTRWFREMKSELKKVVWPTKKQTLNNVIVSVSVMVATGVVIWAFDQLAMLVVQTLISIGR